MNWVFFLVPLAAFVGAQISFIWAIVVIVRRRPGWPAQLVLSLVALVGCAGLCGLVGWFVLGLSHLS